MIKQLETLKQFSDELTDDIFPLQEFYVNRREDVLVHSCLSSYRRDFYKISFISKGTGILSYGNTSVNVVANTLVISNPNTPFLWKPTSDEQSGYFCLFTSSFLGITQQSNPLLYSLLNGNEFVFVLNACTASFFDILFHKLQRIAQVDYILKYELLHNYIQIILHEIINEFGFIEHQTYNSSERLSRKFNNLLESLFPVSSINTELEVKTPQQFAELLMVHVNHLNSVLKENTGKTTTELITERIVKEAQSLLIHTDWSISEIAYCLGFKHPSSFQSFF